MDEDLLLFIRAAIPSVWALELLLFMREHSYRPWNAQELARELRSNPSLTASVLSTLEAAGLASRDAGSYVYGPASQELEDLTGRLAAAYVERPVKVVNAIVKGRSGSIRGFSDAFRVR